MNEAVLNQYQKSSSYLDCKINGCFNSCNACCMVWRIELK